MKTLSKNALIGYPAGIITGITYGLNPLFGMPLMSKGVSVDSILFFRYGIAVLILGAILFFDKQSFKINLKQAGVFDVFLDEDSPFFINIKRLQNCTVPEFSNSYDKIKM